MNGRFLLASHDHVSEPATFFSVLQRLPCAVTIPRLLPSSRPFPSPLSVAVFSLFSLSLGRHSAAENSEKTRTRVGGERRNKKMWKTNRESKGERERWRKRGSYIRESLRRQQSATTSGKRTTLCFASRRDIG